MRIDKKQLEQHNSDLQKVHQKRFDFAKSEMANAEAIIQKLMDFNVAIPSWALGTGGTRFARFSGAGEPGTLEQKMEDVAVLHALNNSSGAISLHIPWDIPSNYSEIKKLAADLNLKFDAMNSNTFQDQKGQALSYKFGSLQNTNKAIRKQAIEHNIEVIKHGVALGSKALTVWLSDGSCFPGQLNFRKAFQNTVGDWGQSLLYANKLGPKAFTLVDLGHHLPNANIEQIVALLMMEEKLAGFHFNDSKYGDDDLTVGSIKPYQLFLIFNELVEGMDARGMNHATDLGWMIDASHNVKDPLEDLLQSVEAIMISYAQALLVDRTSLNKAQDNNDVVAAQEILQSTFRTDVRAIVAEARLRAGGALDPIAFYRNNKVRASLIKERGAHTMATGL